MAFFILPLLQKMYQHKTLISAARTLARGMISVEGESERPCINLFITYLPGQITCYCPSQEGRQHVVVPEANNMPQIMLLLHMQIRLYFNKICDKNKYMIWIGSGFALRILTYHNI